MPRMSNSDKESAIMAAMSSLGNEASYEDLYHALEEAHQLDAVTFHLELVKQGKLRPSVVRQEGETRAVYRLAVVE